MAYERFIGLAVVDQDTYARYRAEMRPLLHAAGGSFQHDFTVARVLEGADGTEINRAFVIRFPRQADSDRFFADPRYLEIRRRLFEPAVAKTVILAQYETATD